ELRRRAVPARVELRLELPDVGREVVLLLAEPALEVGDLLLAQLELVLADLEVGLAPRLARLDLSLALVDLAQPGAERLLRLRERPLALRQRSLALVQGGRTLRGARVLSCELAPQPLGGGGQLLLLRLELPRPLGELLVAARELRLARPELLLARPETLVALL